MPNSCNTSPHQYSPSYCYLEQTIDLELFINADFRREDAGAAVTISMAIWSYFPNFVFLIIYFNKSDDTNKTWNENND